LGILCLVTGGGDGIVPYSILNRRDVFGWICAWVYIHPLHDKSKKGLVMNIFDYTIIILVLVIAFCVLHLALSYRWEITNKKFDIDKLINQKENLDICYNNEVKQFASTINNISDEAKKALIKHLKEKATHNKEMTLLKEKLGRYQKDNTQLTSAVAFYLGEGLKTLPEEKEFTKYAAQLASGMLEDGNSKEWYKQKIEVILDKNKMLVDENNNLNSGIVLIDSMYQKKKARVTFLNRALKISRNRTKEIDKACWELQHEIRELLAEVAIYKGGEMKEALIPYKTGPLGEKKKDSTLNGLNTKK